MPTNTDQSKPLYSKAYTWYALLILTGVYTFNYLDRILVAVLQEGIKADLDLSDTQLGLMGGLVFAIFYTTLGIPIAKLADTKNRRNIVAISLALWSGMTAVTAYAQSFAQMLLARIGVGVGEAGGSPPAHAMISDYFPKEQRATALGVYSMGVYLGITVGYLFGGYMGETYGWRMTFLMLGVPGVLYALLLYFTVKEPPRGYSEPDKKIEKNSNLKEIFKILLSKKTFIFLALASGFHVFVGYGTSHWMASFLGRIHGLGQADAGSWLALTAGVGGGIGTYLGGYLADKLSKKNRRWFMWLPALGIILGLPFGLTALIHGNLNIAMTCYFITNVTFAFYIAPMLAVAHNIVPINMRAMASAVLFLVMNLIGLGFGPLIAGMLSDYLNPIFGDLTLRWVLVIISSMDLIAMLLYLKTSQYVEFDMDRMKD